MQPQFLPAVKQLSFADLVALVTEHTDNPFGTALSILDMMRRQIPIKGIAHPKGAYHVWGAGAAALAALSLAKRARTDDTTPPAMPQTCATLLLAAGGLEGVKRLSARTADEVSAATRLAVLRLTCTQSSLQVQPLHQAARCLDLLGTLEFNSEGDASLRPVAEADAFFQLEYGCSTLDYLSLLFALWSIAPKSIAVDLRNLFLTSPEKQRLLAFSRRVLDRHSCLLQDVETRIADLSAYEAEGLVQAFFSSTPFIKLDAHRYLLPPHPFLRMFAFSGPIFHSLELAREAAARAGSSKPWTNVYSSTMGIRFERQMGEIFAALHPAADRADEYEFVKGEKSPDFILFDHHGAATLVQAKLKKLSPGAFFGYDYDAFLNDCKPLSEMVWKSIRYLRRLEECAEKGTLRPEFKELSDRILACDRYFLLGVSAALPPVFKAAAFRRALDAGVEDALDSKDREWLSRNGKRIIGWHITDAAELVDYAVVRDGRRTLLQDTLGYVNFVVGSKPFATETGLLPSFRDWATKQYAAKDAEAFTPYRHYTRLLFDYVSNMAFGVPADALKAAAGP